MAIVPEDVLTNNRDSRKLLQCNRSLGNAWRLVWMEGTQRGHSTNASAPLRVQVERKRVNLDKLYEEGSEQHIHMVYQWADLAWIVEQIEAAEAAEGEE